MRKKRAPILQKALDQAGGISAVARHLELTRQAVSAWDDVPLKYINELARLSGISRKHLAPSLFGPVK